MRCEAVRGAVYNTRKYQGLGYGKYAQPWERMSPRDRDKAVIGKGKEQYFLPKCGNDGFFGDAEPVVFME